jgi:hypothetical protein
MLLTIISFNVTAAAAIGDNCQHFIQKDGSALFNTLQQVSEKEETETETETENDFEVQNFIVPFLVSFAHQLLFNTTSPQILSDLDPVAGQPIYIRVSNFRI